MTERARPIAYYTCVETAVGPMLVAGYGRRLVAVKLSADPQHIDRDAEQMHREMHGAFDLVRDDAKAGPLARQIADYIEGTRTSFDLDVDLSWVTPFRREVLLETARVPRGEVASYAEIARRVGRPRAFRAVGNTMRTNPIPIVIPCHRVVGSDGTLTGFGGGLDMKRRLLALEGANAR